jgi:hypothetical protein
MTNPNNAVGTNAGFGGRTSPNAFNDNLALYSRGIASGWACTPKSGMTVQIGGNGADRDVAIAEDNAGNRTTINNRSGLPIDVTISGAPATGNRIDSIVAYVENPSAAQSTDVDYAPAVGLITVKGTASGTPIAPTENQIRNAITADGSTGATAYYVVLANITVGQGVTTIGAGVISAGASAALQTEIPLDSIDLSTIQGSDLNPLTTTSRLDIGRWHFYYTAFTNSTAGWVEKTLTVPAEFGGNIKDIHVSATFGNSGNNYGCTWFGQAAGSTSVKVRFNQTTAGSNGWFAVILAIY